MPTHRQDPAPFDAAPLSDPARAAVARDAGVQRVRRATRWLLAGAIGLTGAFAGVAAQQTAPATASASDDQSAASATDEGYGYDDGGYGSDGYGSDEGGYAYDDGGYGGAPQAPQSAPQYVAPSVSSGAS